MAFRPTFQIVALVFQSILIVLFGVLVKYGDDAVPQHIREGTSVEKSLYKIPPSNSLTVYYSSKFVYNRLISNKLYLSLAWKIDSNCLALKVVSIWEIQLFFILVSHNVCNAKSDHCIKNALFGWTWQMWTFSIKCKRLTWYKKFLKRYFF